MQYAQADDIKWYNIKWYKKIKHTIFRKLMKVNLFPVGLLFIKIVTLDISLLTQFYNIAASKIIDLWGKCRYVVYQRTVAIYRGLDGSFQQVFQYNLQFLMLLLLDMLACSTFDFFHWIDTNFRYLGTKLWLTEHSMLST